MKKLLCIFATLAFVALSIPVQATYSLRVGDPRVSWYTQQGTIEEAVLSVQHQGLYLEYGLYLTFSARGTNYNAADSLEVALLFELPEGAIVHDSWLWINNNIVRARILDRWTASSIYENIVQRRQDPSVLYKSSATQYELRIFPMKANETRKVKISFLAPADWNRTTVEADLPVALLKTSRYSVQTFPVIVWPGVDWQKPAVANHPEIEFKEFHNDSTGMYFKAAIPGANLPAQLRLQFDSPLLKGYYLAAYPDSPGGIYQMAILPNQAFQLQISRKLVVLLDYEAGSGTITAEALMLELQQQLRDRLTVADSFNIVVSGLTPISVSDEWLPCDSLHLAAAFNSAGDVLATYSNLASLVSSGINYIRDHGDEGTLLLATNASQYGNYTSANLLIKDLLDLMPSPYIPVHAINYNTGGQYYYIGGQYYYANDYFLVNLSKLSGGSSQTVRGSNLKSSLSAVVQALDGTIRSFDCHTTLESGYCYGRFFINSDPDNAYLNTPILQVGKYYGNFPFRIELAGELTGNFIAAELSIPATGTGIADTLTREIWYGNYIRLLESEQPKNQTINEIIFSSLNERVLSKYTAFLCLEDTTMICPECVDETQFVSTSDPGASDSLFRAWPNPFNDRVTIAVRCGPGQRFAGSASLEIYTTGGQFVRRFDLSDNGDNEAIVIWDGRDGNGKALPAGGYLAIARINNAHQQVLKLIRQE